MEGARNQKQEQQNLAAQPVAPAPVLNKPSSGSKWIVVLIVVILLLVLVLAGAGGFLAWNYFGKQKPVPTPSLAVPTVEPTAGPTVETETSKSGWKTYTNKEYGFSFQYPDKYIEIVNLPKGILATFTYKDPKKKYPAADKISIEKLEIPAGVSFQKVLLEKVVFDPSGMNPKSFEEFLVRKLGSNTFYFIKTGLFEGVLNLSYFLPRETYILGFHLTSYGVDWMNPKFDVEEDGRHVELKQILATFTFSEKSEKKEEALAGWKTYKETNFGYSVDYPPEAEVHEEGASSPKTCSIEFPECIVEEKLSTIGVSYMGPGNPVDSEMANGYAVSISVDKKPAGKSLQDMANLYIKMCDEVILQVAAYTIGSLSGCKYSCRGLGDTTYLVLNYKDDPEKFLMISFSAVGADEEMYLKTIEQIIATLKFD